ncbi:uncharacterized protein LOC124368237 [Homalodisca vitripennis]|uniref:uncharacterized protein LOC124368237 n=1 Tax=Homalodisca vitripennis TaxID=197043 RepID=UPI001EECE809|nr:uncharacterized protein LOC124368237 [Homalodisca vitripennis]
MLFNNGKELCCVQLYSRWSKGCNTSFHKLKNEAIPTLFDFPSNIQPPPKKQRRVVIKKKLPVPIQPPSADLRFEANTSMSSVLLLPLEHDQSVSTPNEQKSTVGLHQTPVSCSIVRW